ncbi:hypothetical protein JCGZ_21023 [Jatropha curcas]|uniref:Uncharacterized protein n=1 Tax=Jatropha curcas TaxID=180498 RepID=A0A067K3U1_JATCU|nr:hypothetical protein JCGZ_21023 [Jatropha curcas]
MVLSPSESYIGTEGGKTRMRPRGVDWRSPRWLCSVSTKQRHKWLPLIVFSDLELWLAGFCGQRLEIEGEVEKNGLEKKKKKKKKKKKRKRKEKGDSREF